MVVGWKRREYRDELRVEGILIRRCHTVTEGTRHTACLLNRVVFFLKFVGSWAKSRSRTDFMLLLFSMCQLPIVGKLYCLSVLFPQHKRRADHCPLYSRFGHV